MWQKLLLVVGFIAVQQGQVPHYGLEAKIDGKLKQILRTQSLDNELSVQSRLEGIVDRARKIARTRVETELAVEARGAAGRSPIGQRSFSGVAAFLGSSPQAKRMFVPSFQQLETFKLIIDWLNMTSVADIKGVMSHLPPILSPNPTPFRPDQNLLDIPIDFDMCPFPHDNGEALKNCDATAPYRTIDGSCNNLKRPLQGRSLTPFARLLQPDYCDGIECPRRSSLNESLPSARLVSWRLFRPQPDRSHVHTHLLMTVGQFLDHDLTKTVVTKLSTNATGGGELSDVTCGSDGCSTMGLENRACVPIAIPPEDLSFTPRKCLMFVRTQESTARNCENGPRQQLNQLTHYVDASSVYGSTKADAKDLRDTDPTRGKLATTPNANSDFKPLLPTVENPDCRQVNATIRCFKAGDDRVNENIALTGMHVIMVRVHNMIEETLHVIKPKWDGERLYQETRKIVGAIWQHIVYNEYLPIVLGPALIHRYRLSLLHSGYTNAYDPKTSAEIYNVFGTAAFRFSHSMISDTFTFTSQTFNQSQSVPVSAALRRPYEIYNNGRPGGSGVDSLIHGLMSQPASQVDRFFTPEVTVRLFSEDPARQNGTDLTSLNLQRGRDHGIPGYNKWRKLCGLPVAKDFRQMPDIVDPEAKTILEELYKDVDDIDLFAGAMSEKLVAAGMVGPTFGCLIARQFRDAKIGDRFWYENGDLETKFTPGQLAEIRKVTLARLICDTLDNVANIQKYVMLQPISEAFKNLGKHNYAEVYSLASLYHGTKNSRIPCDEIPRMDLNEWA